MSYVWKGMRAAAIAAGLIVAGGAQAATEIELFFPVPVDGKLARDMATLIKEFNEKHPDIKATPVYTGSYDETLKSPVVIFVVLPATSVTHRCRCLKFVSSNEYTSSWTLSFSRSSALLASDAANQIAVPSGAQLRSLGAEP